MKLFSTWLSCLLLASALFLQTASAEKALRFDGDSIPYQFSSFDEFSNIGVQNQVAAFWFKRALGEGYSSLWGGGSPYQNLAVSTDGDFEINGSGVGVNIADNDWHQVTVVTTVNSRTENRLGSSQWVQVSYNVNIEYFLDNQSIGGGGPFTMPNRYAYKDTSLTAGADNSAPVEVFISSEVGAFEGWVDDFVIISDLTDQEIEDLYLRGASTIDSSDERVKVYWADEGSFFNIPGFSSNTPTADRIEDSDRPTLVNLISIQSDYGDDQFQIEVLDPTSLEVVETIDGPINQTRIAKGNIANIFAPQYVYLDRYGNELDPTPENIRDFAYYRRVNDGYSAPGATIDGTSPISVKLTVDKDLSFGWSWREEVAVFLESATGNYDTLGAADGGLKVNGEDAVPGKIWVTPGETEITAEIAKSIVPGSGILGADTTPVRFSIEAISEENSANHTSDHYLAFDGVDDRVTYSNTAIPNSNGMTVEFWARRDTIDTAQEQEILRLTQGSNVLRIAFGASPGFASEGMFLSNASTGGVLASIDGGFIDDYWHHWAWAFDRVNQTLRVYRDGASIADFSAVDLGFDFEAELVETYYTGTFTPDPALSTEVESGNEGVYDADGPEATFGPGVFDIGGTAGLNNNGEYVEWTISNDEVVEFTRWLQVRYLTNGDGGGPDLMAINMTVNGQSVLTSTVGNLEGHWSAIQTEVTLQPGTNTIRVTAADLNGVFNDFILVDEIRFVEFGVSDAQAAWGPPVSQTVVDDFDTSGATQRFRFSYSWDGMLWMENDATVEFQTTSDDGSVLTLDGESIVVNDGLQAAKTVVASRDLISGFYEFDLDYFQNIGLESFATSWDQTASLAASIYATDVAVILGGAISENAYRGELNNVRIWGKVLSESEVETSLKTSSFAGRASGLVFEESFEEKSLTSLTTSEGHSYAGALSGFDDNFSSEFETDAKKISVLYPSFDFSNDFAAGNRVSTQTVVANDWLRLGFTWKREYHLQIEVSPDDFSSQPFITVDGVTTSGSATESLWVDEFSDVTVGTRYRTDDRCFTLSSIEAARDEFIAVDDHTVVDGTLDGVATREFNFPALSGPGSVTFVYARTVFQAYVPIGEGLDVSSTAALNARLVPDLCEGGELSLSIPGPDYTFKVTDEHNAIVQQGSIGSVGDPLQWDAVGQQMLPLNVGEYQVKWPDVDSEGDYYLINIVSHLPGETLSVANEIEDDFGYRLTGGEGYVYDHTFSGVSDAFPSSPSAHYRTVYSADANQQPPVELDPSEADRWNLIGMAFSTGGALLDDNSGEFTASSDGRSVLVYTYAPAATDVALGDTGREAYAVRIVEANSIEEVTYEEDVLQDGERMALHTATNGSQGVEVSIPSSTEESALSSFDTTFAFWAKLDDEVSDGTADRVFFEGVIDLVDDSLQFGVHGPDHSTHPGVPFIRKFKASVGAVSDQANFESVTFGNGWHHLALVQTNSATNYALYIDGLLKEEVVFDGAFVRPPEDTSLVLGGDQLSNNLLNGYFDSFAMARTAWDADVVREHLANSLTSDPLIALSFDDGLTFSNQGTLTEITSSILGSISPFELTDVDTFPEVATRIRSRFDTANFGSGYLLNEVSNYNPRIYQRGAQVGTWGPIYPVNWGGLYTASNERLRVAWYENPFFRSTSTDTTLHPNVSWPYAATDHTAVDFPSQGAQKDARIYIASRLGNEGVDVNGGDQLVFDPANYENLTIYNQPDPEGVGFNPNEEHALVAASIKDQLTGDTSFNLGQNAVFALQTDLNVTDRSIVDDYTSESWVLAEFSNTTTGEAEMLTWRVEATREGTILFPQLDSDTNSPIDLTGEPVQQSTDPSYQFDYPTFAGDLVIPPYPVNLVIGSAILTEHSGGNMLNQNDLSQRTIWNDINGNTWCVSGDGRFFQRWWYPMRDDFWFEIGERDGLNDLDSGKPLAWLPKANEFGGFEYLDASTTDSVSVTYSSYWRSDYPVLKRGETLTHLGGEYASENTDAEGLPSIVAWASGQVVYDSANPSMVYRESNLDTFSARLIRPLDRFSVDYPQSDMPEVLTPAFTDNVFADGGRWYFKGLTGSMQKRFYYDSLTQQLVFRGRLNDLESGDPDLTQTPISSYILEPNVMTESEYDALTLTWLTGELGVTSADPIFAAIETIYQRSQDPSSITRTDDGSSHVFYSGVQDYDYSEEDANGNSYVLEQPVFYDENFQPISPDFTADPSRTNSDLSIDGVVANDGTYLWVKSASGTNEYYAANALEADPNFAGRTIEWLPDLTGQVVDLSSDRYQWVFSDGLKRWRYLAVKGSLDPNLTPTSLLAESLDGQFFFDLTDSTQWVWMASARGSDEYYLKNTAGTDPVLPIIESVTETGESQLRSRALAIGTPGSLSAANWGFGDNDGLGYETIYIRLDDETLLANHSDEHSTLYVDGVEFERLQHSYTGLNRSDRWGIYNQESEFETVHIRIGVDPEISQPGAVTFDNQDLDSGAAGSLELGSFAYGDNDGLGYDTLYVRLPVNEFSLVGLDPTDPETLTDLQDLYGTHQPLNSLGTGSALVPDASALTEDSSEPKYITLLENNNVDAGGAVSIHIVQIGEERYRGAIKIVEAADVFDEKINLQHTGDFGANTENVYYQWWVREVDTLENVGLPGDDVEWQIYTEGLGLHSIEFKGRPDITLSDKLFYVRYGEKFEIDGATDEVGSSLMNSADSAGVAAATWRLVDLNDDQASYQLDEGDQSRVPYQWAGAANSPQLQADGSYNFIPQLVMGWVKRVLDRVNPYEARYSDFYNNESPATYSSQIQIAGGPYNGNVALNSDKDVIEGVGLIELYETILDRARSLTLDISNATAGTNQALLLAATRLSFLYEILAREAYSDAQDSTISVTTENGLSSVATFIHAFTNQEPSLMHEELALLRGSDFRKAYPAYNRLFWNYVKGEGEAAYNANYNIHDVNNDGFINEFDAAELYPQGHGDAWGHFLSSNKMHYELLRNTAFNWDTAAELYSLLDNVIEADYLDEKSFARIAAAKARAGNEIVSATYRAAYTEDPDGQWQGYTDDADLARAWGMSEWSKRAGHGAYFDWVVGNVLVPVNADADAPVEGLQQIDRVSNAAELAGIASSLTTIQLSVDEANRGFNPLGLNTDAVVFDIDPINYDGVGGERKTHFEQVYEKALAAAENALAAHKIASQSTANLRKISDDAEVLQTEAFKQDLDYRNRLIEIFGTPYTGNIGPGQIYDDGYAGPDTLLYAYIDRISTDAFLPDAHDRYTELRFKTYDDWASDYSDLSWDPEFAKIEDTTSTLIDRYYLNKDFDDVVLNDAESGDDDPTRLRVEAPVLETADYAFQVPDEDNDGAPDWGSRQSPGEIQMLLNQMVLEQIGLQQSISGYAAYVENVELLSERMQQEWRLQEKKAKLRLKAIDLRKKAAGVQLAGAVLKASAQTAWDFAWQASIVSAKYLPKTVGFSNDTTSSLRGGLVSQGLVFRHSFVLKWFGGILLEEGGKAAGQVVASLKESDEKLIEEFSELNAIALELARVTTQDEQKRLEISQSIKRLENLGLKYQSVLAEGFRLLDEREAYNSNLAGKVQRNRYSDMVHRIARNDAMGRYESAFSQATKFAWLAAKAYDYETGLSEDSPYSATSLREELIRTRTLGYWEDGEPRIGQAGIAGLLAQLKGNFETLEGQLGINNPQVETGKLSLRSEHFRIRDDSDKRWQETLSEKKIVNLWDLPEFNIYCRPFATSADGAQPALVIDFETVIEAGLNVFGQKLGGDDHAYSSSNFATKIRSAGVFLDGYENSGLSTAPRVYLVPVGSDSLYLADSSEPEKRTWNVVEQRIPAPFVINPGQLYDTSFIPSADGLDGSFADIRRFADFRAYTNTSGDSVDLAQLASDSRLIGRSVSNSRWLLIIPGASLHSDADYGLEKFIENVGDIKLVFETYSHAGN